MRDMVKGTDSPKDTLIADILRQCVAFPDSSSTNQLPMWDELAVLRDLTLLERVVEFWKKRITGSGMLICPVGQSGLGLGTVAARAFGRPMIWIDGDGRVIPQSRKIEKLKIAVVDFHSFRGAHFSMAHSRLTARGASQVSFFCAIDCDHAKERLQLPDTVHSLITVSGHKQYFIERFRSLGFADDTFVADRLADGDFWKRHAT